jgi:PAS domain S-box-containing protein
MSRADDPPRHLAPADAHLAAIVESSSDAIISKDLDGIVQSWNRAAVRIFGWTADEMIGQSIRRLIPPDRQDEEDSILRRVRAGELVPKFNAVRTRKDGSSVLLAITVSPIQAADGTIIGASKIAHDITEQTMVQQNLEDSELRFRALADNIPQLAWIAMPDGNPFWFNQRWVELTGVDWNLIDSEERARFQHPDHVEQVRAKWAAEIVRGEGWEDIFPLRSKSGGYRWFLSRAQPIRNAEGKISMWFGTGTDITEQREHEEQVELLMGEVSHRSKNMLAIVQSILHRTAGDVPPEFVAGFEKRIAALAANQDMLIHRGWTGATMNEIVRSQLQPVGELVGQRISLDGPTDVVVRPRAAEALGLAVHELLTNALKYGALSNREGKVAVTWRADGTAEKPTFEVEWRESFGPTVATPTRVGFGSILIERNVRAALSAVVEIDYAPEGLVWKVAAPYEKVVAP